MFFKKISKKEKSNDREVSLRTYDQVTGHADRIIFSTLQMLTFAKRGVAKQIKPGCLTNMNHEFFFFLFKNTDRQKIKHSVVQNDL